MAAGTDRQEPSVLTPSRGGLNSPTLLARITRWLAGASSQPFAAVEDQTDTTAHEASRETATEEKNAQIGRPASEARVSQEATDAARQDEDSTGAIDGPKPLIRITTEAGTIYFMRLEDWKRAKENGARDVPLCDWNGEPVCAGGRKKTLRVSTLSKCELLPMELPTMNGLLHHEQDSGSRLAL